MKRIILSVAIILGSIALLYSATPPDGWRISVEGRNIDLVDAGRLTVGACTACLDGFDTYDDPHRRALPAHYLDLYRQHLQTEPGWENQPLASLKYRAEYGSPLNSANRNINFYLETDITGTVTMNWSIADDLELVRYYVVLRDLGNGTNVDMRENGSYTLTVLPGLRPMQIELTYGKPVAPLAYDQSVTTDEDTPVPITLVAVDVDNNPLTYYIVTPPAHGVLSGTPPDVVYTPELNYFGTDSFTFKANNGSLDSNEATVTVTVTVVNDAPVAFDSAVTTNEDEAVSVTLNATDVDNDPLEYTIIEEPQHGALSGAPPSLAYTPELNYHGTDSFSFSVSDGTVNSNEAMVSITVTSVDDPPLPDFTVAGDERNVAIVENNIGSLAEGATVALFSNSSASYPPEMALDGILESQWRTESGHVSGEYIVVELPGGIAHTIDRVRLINNNTPVGVQHFQVKVSNTLDLGTFVTVLDEIALKSLRVQEFLFDSPVEARYVQLYVEDNWGSAANIYVHEFEVIDVNLAGVPSHFQYPVNAALLSEGASIESVSSQYGSLSAEKAIDGVTGSLWSTAPGDIENEYFVVKLARGKSYPIDRIRLLNTYGAGYGAVKDFRIDVSNTTPDDDQFINVLITTAANISGWQEFIFPDGVVWAKYVRLWVVDHYGTVNFISLYEFEVITVPTAISSYSSYNYTYRPELMLDANTSTAWVTDTGRIQNEYVELRLAGEPLIEKIRILGSAAVGNTEAINQFKVFVSETTDEDSSFVSVMSGYVPNDGQYHEYVVSPEPVRAKYIKLLAISNHGSPSYIRVADFQVIAVNDEGHIISLPLAERNVAKAESPSFIESGAEVVAYSSATPGHEPNRMIDFNVSDYWQTTGNSNEWVRIQLAGSDIYTLEGVRIAPRIDYMNESVKDFQVKVSIDNVNYDLVYSGTVSNILKVQEFMFDVPVQARYVEYVAVNPQQGTATKISTGFFEVIAQERGGLLHESSEKRAANYAEFLLDGTAYTAWETDGITGPHSATIRLSGGVSHTIYAIVIETAINTKSLREFEVWVSEDAEGPYTMVVNAQYSNSITGPQRFVLAEPVQAKYVRLVPKSNYGDTSVIAVGDLRVLEVLGAGAQIYSCSSTAGSCLAINDILDFNPAGVWNATYDAVNNPRFTLLLPGVSAWIIDRVRLQAPVGSYAPRVFEVQASVTTQYDSAFTTVLTGTLENDGAVQDFFFAPVQAKYVRLIIRSKWNTTYVPVQMSLFRVYSPQIGGQIVRFVDRSMTIDGAVVSYAWDFGDGATAGQRDVVHTYASPGVYDVTLTATSDLGHDSSSSHFIILFLHIW